MKHLSKVLVFCAFNCAFNHANADSIRGEAIVLPRNEDSVVVSIQGAAGEVVFNLLQKSNQYPVIEREVRNDKTNVRIYCRHGSNSQVCTFFDLSDGSRTGTEIRSVNQQEAIALFNSLPNYPSVWRYGQFQIVYGDKINCTRLQRRVGEMTATPEYRCRTALWSTGVFGAVEGTMIGVIN